MSLGYRNPLYTESLKEFGTPLHLPQCDGWLLERRIPSAPLRDAMGPYPLFVCSDWSKLADDLELMRGRLVSVSMVTDPFAPLSEAQLASCFDHVSAFKDHFIVSLNKPLAISSHHSYYARRGLKQLRIVRHENPDAAALDRWVDLYANLVQRHHLRGIKAFSRDAFALQLRIPGMVMLEAWHDERVIGAHLWYVEGDLGYSHLMALNEEGYRLYAGYALYWEAIRRSAELFGPSVQRLTLGAGAGIGAAATDGLSWFKRGWSNATLSVYLCGKILDPQSYAALAQTGASAARSDYFPAYRAGEFG